MKHLLLFGAGKSATVLINYLLVQSAKEGWKLTVADANLQLALDKINAHPSGEAVSFDIADDLQRASFIQRADVVISMLPPTLHHLVAQDCLRFARHLLTASYVDDAMRNMATAIESAGILFLCECGLDPGIDHMSAMKIIDEIHDGGGKITSFQSHCGGLVAPESDDNPWHYKISWNPRNIILAGKAGAHYRDHGKEVKLTYEELFKPGNNVNIPTIGVLSWYPNRDSLSYGPLYGLTNTNTFLRTTLRHPDFMAGWQTIIALKLTDENPAYESDGKSVQDIFREHLSKHSLAEAYQELISVDDSSTRRQLDFLGFSDNTTLLNKGLCSAADLLQYVAEKKLALLPADKDMIVMLHEFRYQLHEKELGIQSSLVVKGENSLHTAMAKTVGLPLGIAARLLLKNQISVRGLRIPTVKEIYLPVLKELEEYGVAFHEEHITG